jgi:plasmid stabilization system protein ParE
MPRVRKLARARRDLLILFADLVDRAGQDVAERFIQAAQESFQVLARFPEMGAPDKVRRGKYRGVRLWVIKGFPKYLIAYRPESNGVAIERVFHGSRDYHRILN